MNYYSGAGRLENQWLNEGKSGILLFYQLNEVLTMDMGTAFKLLAFMLWPFLLVFLYYLFNKKGFMRRWEKFKQDGFFK